MRVFILALFLSLGSVSFAQTDERISTFDFVQVLNDNREEALYYYQANWKALRVKALEANFIHSYELLEVEFSEETPYHFILITSYANEEQYLAREENFGALIEEQGELQFLNDKRPADFRKIVFGLEPVKHW